MFFSGKIGASKDNRFSGKAQNVIVKIIMGIIGYIGMSMGSQFEHNFLLETF